MNEIRELTFDEIEEVSGAYEWSSDKSTGENLGYNFE